MNMKKLKKYKNDILIILLFSVIYIGIALILTHGKYVFAAVTDFPMQHYVFPEYFRNLFYETKDLLPDFALNIGGGQNIYNFAYYGLLNPYILLSYLLPMVPMFYYLIGTSFIVVVASAFLFYKFLLSHNINKKTSLVGALLFLFATPIMFHAKRHIMFINYFPFLILGLFGVDRWLQKKKIGLLTTSLILMILTSFYYSVSGIFVLIIYGIYQYAKEKHTKKEYLKFLCAFSVPILIAVLTTAILWLPTAYTLLTGRGEGIKELKFWELLIPSFKSLYTAFSPGITLLEFILIGILMIDKDTKKRTRILALSIIIIFLIPIFNYILNGTLYINAKSLIPFLPLALLLVTISLESLTRHKKKIEAILLVTTCIITITANFIDPLISKEKIKNSTDQEYRSLIEQITKKDSSFYRINNSTNTSAALNRVYNMNEYKSSVYSSTQNKEYQDWIKKEQKNNQFYRNGMMLTLSGDILSESMMGEKYKITTSTQGAGYHLIQEQGKLKLYENEYVLPIFYATETKVEQKEYKDLSYPYNVIASYTNEIEEIETSTTSFEVENKKHIEITKENDVYTIKAKKKNHLTLTPTEDLSDKVVFLTVKNAYNKSCRHSKNDQSMTINGIKNKLTCKEWKYHNRNKVFHYVLISPEKLEISFDSGKYKLTDINIINVPKEIFLEAKDDYKEVNLDKDETKGDKIVGTINLDSSSNIVLAVPYDKGFTVEVDGKQTTYTESIQNTITFPIKKGNHTIVITYQAPWKKAGSILSIIGLISFMILLMKQKISHK